MKLIIFTDLDGSLLNFDDYSFEDATASLERIRQAGIPLVMVTSKTRREVESLRDNLGFDEPFIVENGGGIFFPTRYRGFPIPNGRWQSGYTVVRLGVPYIRIRRFFVPLREQFKVMGFGDLSIKDIARHTGLSHEKAILAKIREFTEPFHIEDEADLTELSALAKAQGMKITRGGRFQHLIGAGQDKGAAVRIVRDIFRENIAGELVSIGIGDSENDLPMLEQVDIPVLIPHPVRGYLDIQLPRLMRAREHGCRGWNEAVGRILDEFATNH